MVKIREMTPDTHTFLHVSRGDRRGVGVGIFISKSFSKIRKEKVPKTGNFELMQASCRLYMVEKSWYSL